MLIRELLNEDFNSDEARLLGYWTPNEDGSVPQLRGMRKTRLLLKDIRRLRQMTDAKRAEQLKKLAFLRDIYKWVPPKGF